MSRDIRQEVSIHAPVKGATVGVDCRKRAWRVSIHAPVKGATFRFSRLGRVVLVSIHAPVKGATWAAPTGD